MADPNELKAFQDIYEELVRLHEELGLEAEDVLKNSDVLESETLHTVHEEMRTPVIDANGNKVNGTFMTAAEGMDPDHLPPEAEKIMLDAICRALDCQPGDILEYAPGEMEEE